MIIFDAHEQKEHGGKILVFGMAVNRASKSLFRFWNPRSRSLSSFNKL